MNNMARFRIDTTYSDKDTSYQYYPTMEGDLQFSSI